MEIVILLWLFCGIMSAVIAASRGRSGGAWLLLGMLIGPLALAVALLPTAEAKLQAQARQEGQALGWRKCPFCAEVVREEAAVCRYCQRELTPVARLDQQQARDRAKADRAKTIAVVILVVVVGGVVIFLWLVERAAWHGHP
jgi:hypothetical protein